MKVYIYLITIVILQAAKSLTVLRLLIWNLTCVLAFARIIHVSLFPFFLLTVVCKDPRLITKFKGIYNLGAKFIR